MYQEAGLHHSYNACMLLIEHGADPNYRSWDPMFVISFTSARLSPLIARHRKTPAEGAYLGLPWGHKTRADKDAALKVTGLLYSKTELEPEPQTYFQTKEDFSLWQQHADPSYYEQPLEVRFELTMKLTSNSWNEPEF